LIKNSFLILPRLLKSKDREIDRQTDDIKAESAIFSLFPSLFISLSLFYSFFITSSPLYPFYPSFYLYPLLLFLPLK
jgi:hypothetical protein